MACIRNTDHLIKPVEKTLIVFIVCSDHQIMSFTDVYAKQKKKSQISKLQNLNEAELNKRRV